MQDNRSSYSSSPSSSSVYDGGAGSKASSEKSTPSSFGSRSGSRSGSGSSYYEVVSHHSGASGNSGGDKRSTSDRSDNGSLSRSNVASRSRSVSSHSRVSQTSSESDYGDRSYVEVVEDDNDGEEEASHLTGSLTQRTNTLRDSSRASKPSTVRSQPSSNNTISSSEVTMTSLQRQNKDPSPAEYVEEEIVEEEDVVVEDEVIISEDVFEEETFDEEEEHEEEEVVEEEEVGDVNAETTSVQSEQQDSVIVESSRTGRVVDSQVSPLKSQKQQNVDDKKETSGSGSAPSSASNCSSKSRSVSGTARSKSTSTSSSRNSLQQNSQQRQQRQQQQRQQPCQPTSVGSNRPSNSDGGSSTSKSTRSSKSTSQSRSTSSSLVRSTTESQNLRKVPQETKRSYPMPNVPTGTNRGIVTSQSTPSMPVPSSSKNSGSIPRIGFAQTGIKSIAVLGTMSDAGKSVIAAAICRILLNGGKRVAPFKAQNMSNNAAPALLPDNDRRNDLYKSFERAAGGVINVSSPVQDPGYGEIGTAQSLQAEACKLVPRVEMNPVLLKSGGKNSKGEAMCSVFVLGKQMIRETYSDLRKRTGSLQQMVLGSHKALAEVTKADVIVIEGAGSCTELNLMDRDIVNLPLVRSLQCPWLLVANIDCGGVFAQVVGTKACCSERDWSLCVGVVVNKLRGDPKFFLPGPRILEQMVGKPIFVVPYLEDLNLPEEDGMGIERRLAWEKSAGTPYPHKVNSTNRSDSEDKPVVVVVAYPHTAIADDLCPLEGDPRFKVEWRRKILPKPYPHTSAIVLPGSRLTIADLKWLNDSGWLKFIRTHVAAGGSVLGLCGGYQMLGWQVDDPDAVEGCESTRQGIGILPIKTTIGPVTCKVVEPKAGQLYPSGVRVEGFELHCGRSEVLSAQVSLLGKNSEISPLLAFSDGRPEGMQLGRVRGTYLHGILRSDEARVELLVPNKNDFPIFKKTYNNIKVVDPLDKFANHLSSCGLDSKTLSILAGL